MKVEDFLMEEPKPLKTLANVFPGNSLTLLHGMQGSGKSYSTILALNNDGIKPVYIAVEQTTGLEDLDKDYSSVELLRAMKKNKPVDGINGRVIVVDTYTRLHALVSGEMSDIAIVEMLEEIIKEYNVTIIVIGHTRNFVGKDGIFDDNKHLARCCTEELFLQKNIYKATSKQESRIEYDLFVNKGRGEGGSRIIKNWMRE